MKIRLHNTLTKQLDTFTPQSSDKVTLYTCGPTVYDRPHVGNWVAYIYWDTLVRMLESRGLTVERVMNITDVGHLVSDGDEGEDKLEKGARREGKTAWEVAEFYTSDFLAGMEKLGLRAPAHIARATDYIAEQLELVRMLKNKGYTYQISDGIYFDTTKFPHYGDFAGLNTEELKAGARVEFNPEKRSASDFALWKFSPGGVKRDMEWETPNDLLDNGVGEVMGFPGWHLECSAIAMKFLGNTLDIHTGGIDHIPVHHTNEIAQSEAATGAIFSRFWLHNNHMKVDGSKISKSLGNGYTLQDIEERGFSPLDFRMLVLQSHYQTESNFSFDVLEAAKNRRQHWRDVAALRWQGGNNETTDNHLEEATASILRALNDNLNTPEVMRTVDAVFAQLESRPINELPRTALANFIVATLDNLLGLQLANSTPDISDDDKNLVDERQKARVNKDWAESDRIRDDLLAHGIAVRDTSSGTIWSYV